MFSRKIIGQRELPRGKPWVSLALEIKRRRAGEENEALVRKMAELIHVEGFRPSSLKGREGRLAPMCINIHWMTIP